MEQSKRSWIIMITERVRDNIFGFEIFLLLKESSVNEVSDSKEGL